MDWGRQRELLPHYGAVAVAIVAYLWAVRAAVGAVHPVAAVAGAVVVVLGYPTVVRTLGVAPSAWEE